MRNAEKAQNSGYVYEIVKHEGFVLPQRAVGNYMRMNELEIRDDDILISTFPKSGTHWTWEIVSMLVKGKAEYAEHWQNIAHLGGRTPDQLNQLPSPRVFFSHLFPTFLPKGFLERKCPVINVQRNPKDVIVSRYMQDISQNWFQGKQEASFTGTWDDYVQLYIDGNDPEGPICEHQSTWNSFPQTHPDVPFLQIHFEDLKKDALKEVRRIAEFLKRPLPEDIYKEIVNLCEFENLKEASEKQKDQTFHVRWKEGTSGYFRKGKMGDWKNHFTVAQSEGFDTQYKKVFNCDFPY